MPFLGKNLWVGENMSATRKRIKKEGGMGAWLRDSGDGLVSRGVTWKSREKGRGRREAEM